MANNKHILVAIVQDRPGVLNRVASLLRRRSFNIVSITVGHTNEPERSRMTIVVSGGTGDVEQVRKQLKKLIDVVNVTDITDESIVAREMALIKVKSTAITRSEIMQIVDIFRANIVDVAPDSLTVEVTGDEDKVESLYQLMRGFGVKEMARTGLMAMTRGTLGPLPVEEPEIGRQRKLLPPNGQ